MAGFIRRTSYVSMLGLSYQSYRSTQSMTSHLTQMVTHASTSESLTAQSTTDLTTANTLHSESITESIEAQQLIDEATLFTTQAKEDEVQAMEDQSAATSIQTQNDIDTTTEMELETKITAEELVYQNEMEKGIAESTAMASNTANTETDTFATAFCEFIPFVDIMCDFIGSIAAVGFESNVVKLSSQSAIDYTAASTTKTQEDTDILELTSIQTTIAEQSILHEQYNQNEIEEEMKSKLELQEAKSKMEEATTIQTQSNEEEMDSQVEQSKGETEEVTASDEMDVSIKYGLYACKDAIVVGLLSVLSVCFFMIRLLIGVVIPGSSSFFTFMFYAMGLILSSVSVVSRSASTATATTTTITGGGGGVSKSPTTSATRLIWNTIPKREISYFILHIGVYISTYSSIWFITGTGTGTVTGGTQTQTQTKFELLTNYTVRSRGGIVVLFAITASFVQGLLLHSIPYFITLMKQQQKRRRRLSSGNGNGSRSGSRSGRRSDIEEGSEVSSLLSSTSLPTTTTSTPQLTSQPTTKSSSSSSSSIPTIIPIISKTILKQCKAILYLTPLFIIETTTIWLLFGQWSSFLTSSSFQFHTPPFFTSMVVGLCVFIGCIVYIILFEITYHDDGDHDGDDYDHDHDHEIQEQQYHDNQQDNDRSSSTTTTTTTTIVNETQSLLTNDYIHNNKQSNIEIELSHPGDDNEGGTNGNGNENVNNNENSIPQAAVRSRDGKNNEYYDYGDDDDDDDDHHYHTSPSVGDLESIPLTQDGIQEYNSISTSTSTSTSTNMTLTTTQGLNNTYYSNQNNEMIIKRQTQQTQVQQQQQSSSKCQNIQSTIDEYISDLKLPFEILIMTCMVVLLKGCIPILVQLLPKVIKSHKLFFIELSGVLLVICILLWYLVRTNNQHGHVGLWTGASLRH